ncbi:MAG: outer membrane lipoprotein carrier protein LolA [Planctomycetes bacterium]|nr:outer membrane lipoprotein carrier protein LolA [Planctomycetota bacterium]
MRWRAPIVAFAVAGLAAAQQDVEAAVRIRAETLLRAHARHAAAVKVLVADYVQRRTTELATEPLVSSGQFLFVREPAAVLFRAATPRVSVVKLSTQTYEVFRPSKRQLERFHLDGPELAQGLFAAVGGDVERLLAAFTVAGCSEAAGERVTVRLLPKDPAVAARLRELAITLVGKDAVLGGVAYRDPAGDLVEIELANLQPDPKDPPAARLDVGKDTVVVEHAAKKAPLPPAPKAPAK